MGKAGLLLIIMFALIFLCSGMWHGYKLNHLNNRNYHDNKKTESHDAWPSGHHQILTDVYKGHCFKLAYRMFRRCIYTYDSNSLGNMRHNIGFLGHSHSGGRKEIGS